MKLLVAAATGGGSGGGGSVSARSAPDIESALDASSKTDVGLVSTALRGTESTSLIEGMEMNNGAHHGSELHLGVAATVVGGIGVGKSSLWITRTVSIRFTISG